MALLAWAAPVSAIKVEGEKIEKKDDAQSTDKQSGETAKESSSQKSESTAKSGGNLLDQLRRSVVESKKDETPKYDQFKDANNDGVSDQVPKSNPDEGKKSNEAVKTAKPQPKVTPKAAPKTKAASTQTLKKKTPETSTTKKKKP